MKKIILLLLFIGIVISCSIGLKQQEIDIPDGETPVSIYPEIDEIGFDVFEDTLQGSEITVAKPTLWNRRILIIAHGYRPEDSELSSAFSINDPFYENLLSGGWIIASTSYRRNGLILHEAVEDIEFLRKYLEDTYGIAEEIYLQGSSMGATISTLIAEDPSLPYSGVLAISFPRYHLFDIGDFNFSFDPKIPILFVSNRDETEAPEDYIANTEDATVKPAFWTIDRDGHVAVNSSELLLAFYALLSFTRNGEIKYLNDGTIPLNIADPLADHRDGKAYTEVLNVHPAYGNFEVKMNILDLQKLGIEKDTYFRVGFQDRYFRIFYGTTYSDVLQGFWVAFTTAEGYVRIARNFADAASSLKCSSGDLIYIEPLPEDEQTVEPYIEPGSEAVDLGIESWQNLISGNIEQAVILAEKGLAIEPDILWLQMNLAHAYLYNGDYEKAIKIYTENKGKHVLKESFYFEDIVVEDLDKLETEGLTSEYSNEVRKLMQE